MTMEDSGFRTNASRFIALRYRRFVLSRSPLPYRHFEEVPQESGLRKGHFQPQEVAVVILLVAIVLGNFLQGI